MRNFKLIIQIFTVLILFLVELLAWYIFLKVKLKIKYYYNLLKLKYTLTRRRIPRELREYIVKTYSKQYKQFTSFSLRRILVRSKL